MPLARGGRASDISVHSLNSRTGLRAAAPSAHSSKSTEDGGRDMRTGSRRTGERALLPCVPSLDHSRLPKARNRTLTPLAPRASWALENIDMSERETLPWPSEGARRRHSADRAVLPSEGAARTMNDPLLTASSRYISAGEVPIRHMQAMHPSPMSTSLFLRVVSIKSFRNLDKRSSTTSALRVTIPPKRHGLITEIYCAVIPTAFQRYKGRRFLASM
ncbi:MAG: hypothetical protein A4E29_00139 [Methanomassiliicoccales archaeon PtaB.Bin134]|nr:MAG: hypothetical protein A4E29_00139 [Methanomassiliicoccales archaeon PtaB.Bin134]